MTVLTESKCRECTSDYVHLVHAAKPSTKAYMCMGKKIERVFCTRFHQNIILGAHLQNPFWVKVLSLEWKSVRFKNPRAGEARTRVILCAQIFYIKFTYYIQHFSSSVGVNAILRNLPRSWNCVIRPQWRNSILCWAGSKTSGKCLIILTFPCHIGTLFFIVLALRARPFVSIFLSHRPYDKTILLFVNWFIKSQTKSN